MIDRLLNLVVTAYDYCKVCGWWVKDCGHPQG